MMRTRNSALIALALFALVGLLIPAAFAAKGGKGKPPPAPTTPADPAITFRTSGGVWVMNDDGSNQTVLYDDPSTSIYSPTWSGDAASISFVEEDPYLPEPNSSLQRIDVDVVDGAPLGSNRTTVVDDVEVWLADWSPTDEVIAFIAQPDTWEDRELRLVPADGGVQNTLYTASFGDCLQDLTWSPDGTQIAIIESTEDFTQGHVRIIDVDTGAITTLDLPRDARHDGFGGVSWARTQDVLAYTERIKKTTVKGKKVTTSVAWRIHLLDLATGDAEELTGGERPAWSPDDAYLVWTGVRKYEFSTGVKEDLTGNLYGIAPDWR